MTCPDFHIIMFSGPSCIVAYGSRRSIVKRTAINLHCASFILQDLMLRELVDLAIVDRNFSNEEQGFLKQVGA